MTDGKFNPTTGKAAGKKSGIRRLTLRRVEQELPPLTDLDSAMYRLDRVGIWTAANLMSGTGGNAVVRSIEVWLKAHESKMTQQDVEKLRHRLDELEGQLKQQRALGVVR